MATRTHFGLEIVSSRSVRRGDIARLPFAEFWEESAVRSGQLQDKATGEWLIHLRDWDAFCSLFIATGRHRNMAAPPQVLWFDRDDDEPTHTYFGLEVLTNQMVREADIKALPFYAFWYASSIGSAGLADPVTREHFVHLHDWQAFAQLFIRTGRHRFSPHDNTPEDI